jgi:hypothetical protein
MLSAKPAPSALTRAFRPGYDRNWSLYREQVPIASWPAPSLAWPEAAAAAAGERQQPAPASQEQEAA